jgi:hypothetical protein
MDLSFPSKALLDLLGFFPNKAQIMNLTTGESESKSWAGEKTPVKVRGIVTAVSEIYQRSARR